MQSRGKARAKLHEAEGCVEEGDSAGAAEGAGGMRGLRGAGGAEPMEREDDGERMQAMRAQAGRVAGGEALLARFAPGRVHAAFGYSIAPGSVVVCGCCGEASRVPDIRHDHPCAGALR